MPNPFEKMMREKNRGISGKHLGQKESSEEEYKARTYSFQQFFRVPGSRDGHPSEEPFTVLKYAEQLFTTDMMRNTSEFTKVKKKIEKETARPIGQEYANRARTELA